MWSRQGGEGEFSSLHSTMPFPYLGKYLVAQKKIFSSSHTHFVSETTQNYHFCKIVTKMAINGQYNAMNV